jgi:hypothetical protein
MLAYLITVALILAWIILWSYAPPVAKDDGFWGGYDEYIPTPEPEDELVA